MEAEKWAFDHERVEIHEKELETKLWQDKRFAPGGEDLERRQVQNQSDGRHFASVRAAIG